MMCHKIKVKISERFLQMHISLHIIIPGVTFESTNMVFSVYLCVFAGPVQKVSYVSKLAVILTMTTPASTPSAGPS